jgi:hypothetical protein
MENKELSHFHKVLNSKFNGRPPTMDNIVELQQYFLEELSGTWEWTYKRYMDLQKNDRSKMDYYDHQSSLVIDKVSEWYKVLYTLRIRYANTIVTSKVLFEKEREACKDNVSLFINNWLWLHEPRMANLKNSKGEGMSPKLPFVMYGGQQRVVEEIQFCYEKQLDFIIAKSREAGISWGAMAWVLHKWLFTGGYTAGIASEKEVLVDDKGSNKPLFGKVRYMLYELPSIWRPTPYRRNEKKGTSGKNNPFDNMLKLINPDNGSEILGQVGESIGEGGRFSSFIIDEEQNLSNPDNVNRALESTTNCRGAIGTSRGMNHFGQKWADGIARRISVMWHEDPRKVGNRYTTRLENETYDKDIPKDCYWRLYTEARLKSQPEVLAQAYDMDWQASVTNLCIEPKWIEAAVEFKLPEGGHDDNTAGFDVAGGGSNSSVYISGTGNKIDRIEEVRMNEVVQNIWAAHRYAVEDGVTSLQYDKQAIGESMYGTIMDGDVEVPYQLVGVAGNDPASSKLIPDEGTAANKIYRNKRSEIWNHLRILFRNTYMHVTEGMEFEADQMISIPNHPKLKEQLAYPKRELKGGRWKIESKEDMRSRGLKSPDFADACAYKFGDFDSTARGVLSNFTRSANKDQYRKIEILPNQKGWEYVGSIFHNEFNEVSALLARWHPYKNKLEIVDEFMADSPRPQEILQSFTKLLSQMEAQKITWVTQKKLFDDMFKGEYKLHSIYHQAKIKLTYSYAEDQKVGLLLADQMFDKGIITVSTDCRQLVAQISGLELSSGKLDSKYGLPNSLMLIVQSIKERKPKELKRAMGDPVRPSGYSTHSAKVSNALLESVSLGQSNVL